MDDSSNRKGSLKDNKSSKNKLKMQRSSARERLPSMASAQFITNQKFSYLRESLAPNSITPNLITENKQSPTSPIKSIIVTESPRVFTNGYQSMSPIALSPSNLKQKRNARKRQPSVCVETTRSQKEQLSAITKEVEFLQNEVPHFKELFAESQMSFIASKRKKNDLQAFILIQALSNWIVKYGNVAVKEYEDFKIHAEIEMISMLGQIEDLHHQNDKLGIFVENVQLDNEETKALLKEKERIVKQLKSEAEILVENAQTNQLHQQEIEDLAMQLEDIQNEKNALQEKYDRIQNYYSMLQTQNDELAKKNYTIQGEMKLMRDDLVHAHKDMKMQSLVHMNTIQKMEIEHENIQHEMEREQDKLIAAAHHTDDIVFSLGSDGAEPMSFIVDDSDIEASGVMELEDGESGPEVFLLSNEIDIDLYEYEDDQWLDETDDEYDEEPYPSSPMKPKSPAKDEEFVMEKQSYSQDIEYKDASLQFTAETQSFGVEVEDKSAGYEMESQQVVVDTVVKPEPEPELEFKTETTATSVEDIRRKSLDDNAMEMSSVSTSVTQAVEPAVDADWETTKEKVSGVEVEVKPKSFFSSSMAFSQKNLVPKVKIVRPRHDRPMTPEEEKIIMGGKNFKDRLALFRKLEVTRGGRPQILAEAKAWALQNRWLTASQVAKRTTGDKHVFKATVPHMNDSQTRGASIITITKTKRHTLKPRLYGYMKVIKCHFIPAYLLSQEPRFFFCLDGLPSKTNIRKSEPDFAKNRKNDFLTPCLFFFATKEKFDEFHAVVKQEPVRSVKFQKAFAQYAKGIFPLNEYVTDITVGRCLAALKYMNGGRDIKLPRGEEDSRAINDEALFVCNKRECHRFHLTDKHSRNAWMKKISKLVNKRKATITPSAVSETTYNASIAQMILPVVSSVYNDNTPVIETVASLKYKPSAKEITRPPFASNGIINRNSSASVARMARLSKVEGEFD